MPRIRSASSSLPQGRGWVETPLLLKSVFSSETSLQLWPPGGERWLSLLSWPQGDTWRAAVLWTLASQFNLFHFKSMDSEAGLPKCKSSPTISAFVALDFTFFVPPFPRGLSHSNLLSWRWKEMNSLHTSAWEHLSSVPFHQSTLIRSLLEFNSSNTF